uniref:DUF3885 domain-containing protein n=1 Tax=Hymenobacter gelipurpurascens TaxID=89968 RepID=UPI003743ADBD
MPYAAILRAISHQDFRSRKHLNTLHGETYFFNQRTSLLFHIYDDRGVDVLGPTAASLHPLYETYNRWILEYDRPRINTLFGA